MQWSGCRASSLLPIQRMRTLCPRYDARLNFVSTQTPCPEGSTAPGPAQSPTDADVVPLTVPQCDHAPCGKHIVSCAPRDRKSVVEGKRGDLGGRRII